MATPTTTTDNRMALAIGLTIVGAIVGLVALFSMPVASCQDLDMKVADFGDEWKVRAFDFCANDLGQGTSPGPGLLVGALGGLGFIGGGIWFVTLRRASSRQTAAESAANGPAQDARQAAPSGFTPSTAPPPSQATLVHQTVLLAAAPTDSSLRPPGAPVPSVQTTIAPPPSLFTYTKPTIAERMASARPATFGRRAFAFLIDLAVLVVLWFTVFGVLAAVAGEDSTEDTSVSFAVLGVLIAIFFCYHWLLALTGATLGMRALGMRIVMAEGGGLTSSIAAKRAAVLTGGCAILYGPFSGLTHPEGRTWHDLASGTGVVAM